MGRHGINLCCLADLLFKFHLGIQPGAPPHGVTYALDEMPSPEELRILGDKFRPHRSVAAWYFWRATDLARQHPRGSAA
jgi:hypothetical protein